MYLIHYKNLCKCHTVLPPSTTIKKKIFSIKVIQNMGFVEKNDLKKEIQKQGTNDNQENT
jgi:hypothetical protein